MSEVSHEQDTLQAESDRAISSSPEIASNVKVSLPVTEKRITRPPNAFILFRAEQVKLIKETEPELRSKPQSELSKIIGERWKSVTTETRSMYDEKAEGLKRQLLEKYGPGALARGPRKPRKSETAPTESSYDGRPNSGSGSIKAARTTSHSSAPILGHSLANNEFQYALPPASGNGAPSSHHCAVMAPWHPSFVPNASRTELRPRPLSSTESPTHASGMVHVDSYFSAHHTAQSIGAHSQAVYASTARIPQRGEAIRFASGNRGMLPSPTMMGSMPRAGELSMPAPTAHRSRPNPSPVAFQPYGHSTSYYSARAPESYWSTEAGSVSSRSRSWNQLPRSARVSQTSDSRSWDERHGLHDATTDDRDYQRQRQPQYQAHHQYQEYPNSGTQETYFTAQHGTCLYPLPPISNDGGGGGDDGRDSTSTAAELEEAYAYVSREMFQTDESTEHDHHREATWDQLVQWDADGSVPASHAH
ncbi:hypothetical protein MVLG_00275 [Microbotryum lychnidis-dioicae p1A1 Lamole]|uniref:HMG box domain-containing protein n=1 Tax=Microbotryum lychnidis-dioicae (strain p1A1 Lamole / MvSl-1064) TaxID=683840 RepID=U5GYK9_USTV1|nr:hypothetical protein MVLG_00275 [Microbotryum lychnidis-dioicae p1A1 Lamole]|eukprot:KDE09878.1 hypothetical protein MVLG_00275 [Microbotryum lychnidis-dioicae p1A1 Lamole]